MKRKSLILFIATLLLGSATALTAQEEATSVDRTKYPDYTEATNPDWSLMAPAGGKATRAASQRPDHVNNAATRHFPPVFNQAGGSCGSASRISYMFSYELAAYRNLDGSKAENHYPSHFVWLHTNSPNQGKNEFVTQVGVPSAATYGGQTYSSLFGYQEESYEDFGWMQGYDKWYEAMHNRMLNPVNFPVSVASEEGREAVKNWLWNHNGDESFAAGGICGIGVASGGNWQKIASTEANDAAGVTDMYYVKAWGTQVDHALTIVGYDDRIEFDLNGNGVYGEAEADELGAWIIVNSWGAWWCNSGFIYCPYAHGVPYFNNDGTVPTGSAWMPEVYHVRKDYRPLRTIKLEMDYSRRSEIALSAGISSDITATEPEKTISFVHFTYAGDGHNGNSNPAPEVPMLGRWADGKLHSEPMEFGYDLTDLSKEFDMNQPLKYFFIIDSRSWAQGKGTIHGASIMDYRIDELGVETPFAVGEGVEIKNAGGKTIITVVVQGFGYNKPQNVAFTDGTLTWQAPLASGSEVTGYEIYYNDTYVKTLSAEEHSYTPEEASAPGEYAVVATYSDGAKSEGATARVPLSTTTENVGMYYDHAGFTIPDVMKYHYENATIEYWLKPSSLAYWNQSGGTGLTSFFFYATQYGQYSAGWNYYGTTKVDHAITYNAPLEIGVWKHIAIVVEKNKIRLYVNGTQLGTCTSDSYSGLGGFGDLIFASNDAITPNGAQHGVYDEVRIWSTARTQQEIKDCMYKEFTGSIMPQGLITYLRGDLITDEKGNVKLYDYAGGHHATLQGNYEVVSTDELGLTNVTGTPTISINEPKETVYAGIPVTLTATYNNVVNRIVWNAETAGVKGLSVAAPSMTFATAGTHNVTATAHAADGTTATATHTITVAETPEADATFVATAEEVPTGERVSFHVVNPQRGCSYKWSMPGSETKEASAPSVATSYAKKGTYTVTLTATAPNGQSKTQSMALNVREVAPKANFDITPAVALKGDTVRLIDRSLYGPTRWTWYLKNANHTYIAFAQDGEIEISTPGVYDVTLEASNAMGTGSITREKALVIANADSKNGLYFSSDAAKVTMATPPISKQKRFTVEWWMNPTWPSTFCNGIGESEKTFIIKCNAEGQLRAYINGEYATTENGVVISGEWHHYAITCSDGVVNFFRDGTYIAQGILGTKTLPELTSFAIGGAQAPFKGGIDELRIWKQALNTNQLKEYANAPIVDVDSLERVRSLALYYNFNHNGGDVQDLTSNANHGTRSGFGPDGDAWALSKGVFSLNIGESTESTSTDITAQHLTNYVKPFAHTSSCVNPNIASRAYALKGWTLENALVEENITTGAYVDKEKNSCFTVSTQWDGFAQYLGDHKAFQTITLPAGYYTFEAEYDERYSKQCGGSYLVAAQGNTLPETENLGQAIAYQAMKDNVEVNKMGFYLAEESTVSLGVLVNMGGEQCMALQRFGLKKEAYTVVTPTNGVEHLTPDHEAMPHSAAQGVYDLAGRQLRTSSQTQGLAPGLYIIDGRKVVVK